jgi:hypothetical protein
MAFIPVNLDDAVEQRPASAGNYNLQITAAQEVKTGPNSKHPGSPQFKVTIGFPDDPNTPNLTQFISLPSEYDDRDQALFKMLLLKRFLALFNIGYDSAGIDTEKLCMEMVGATANAAVSLTEPDDNGNVYNRLIVPRMRDEAAQVPARKRR